MHCKLQCTKSRPHTSIMSMMPTRDTSDAGTVLLTARW